MKGLLFALLAFLAACRTAAVERAAPGQPSMNELLHRRAEKAEAESAKWKSRAAETRSMTAEQARALVEELKRQPDDQVLFSRLVWYFQLHSDVGPRSQLALWYIANHPNGTVAPETIHPAWSRVNWEKGAALWRKNLRAPEATAETSRRAARYLQGNDKAEAERVLLAAKEKYPNESWAAPLGQLYALAILGAVGPLAEGNTVRDRSEGESNGPFARNVRAKLDASNDVALLGWTAQCLMMWSRMDRPGHVPFLDLAKGLADRAAAIDPNDRRAIGMKLRIAAFEDGLRLHFTPLASLNEEERLRLTALALGERPTWQSGPEEEVRARELLKLAAARRSDPAYGDAVYAANLMLGRVALKRGDRRESARFLLASVEGPVTDRLRLGDVDMTLARDLVDWGEREAVARFLERCSRFNVPRGKEQALWAADIRRGINPELIPYHQ